MTNFELEGREFIELNKLLKMLNLVGSGGEANFLISEGEIEVNGETETRKRKKLRVGDKIIFGENQIIIIE